MTRLAPRKKRSRQLKQHTHQDVDRKPPEVDLGPVSNLAVICCYYNPMRCPVVKGNAEQFLSEIKQYRKTISANFGHQPDLPNGSQIQVGPQHLLWQKERMLNLVEQRVPDHYDAIAWIDMDVLLLNQNWADEALASLRHNHVVQLWENSYESNGGSLRAIRPSVASAYEQGQSDCFHLGRYHPGFAWAMRRDTWKSLGGLLDTNIVGNGDTHMCRGFFNADLWTDRFMSPKWKADADDWKSKAAAIIKGHVGCVPGDIIHLWHGDRQDRKYVDRLSYLGDHDYDPTTDIEIDPHNGLYRWTAHALVKKPEMVAKVKGYFHERAVSVQSR